VKRLAVYCGSASPADSRYVELARHVGTTLARRGIGLVYGGGRLGLMGAVASGAGSRRRSDRRDPRSAGQRRGFQYRLHRVARRRQHAPAQAGLHRPSDGFLTIPGGVGTMDELWEAVSWAQLGYHAKPVGLLNAFGFYDHLIAFNRHMIEVGFIREAHRDIIAEPDLDLLLARMAAHEPHTPIFAMKAADL
jgi:uncharacterized protein (TIGR00730 family)